ncbi:MAG TPA: hypothetical protein VGB74_14875 [Actinoplanes sp.]|jgi:hypothetical protein
MSRGRIGTAARGLAVLTVIAGSAAVPVAVFAADDAARPQVTTLASAAADRLVTLPTGERVFLGAGSRAVRTIEPAAGTTNGPARVRTMAVGDHLYVVPEEALPYVGRQLDLALFDVLAPATSLTVEWAAAARPVPGLALEAAAGGRSVGRIADPAAFGAALARSATEARTAAAAGTATGTTTGATTGALAGVRSVRTTAAAEPTAVPNYPLVNLTVRGLDKLGVNAFSGSVSVTNAEDVQRFSSLQSFVDGEVSFSVPVGHYSLQVSITTYDATSTYLGDSLLIFPELEVSGTAVELVADARTAKVVVPVPATPNPAGLEQLQATYSRVSAAGFDTTTAYMLIGGSPSLSVTPTSPVSIGKMHWYTYFRLNSPATATERYLYDLVFPTDGVIPAQFTAKVAAADLAQLDATYAAENGASPITTSRTSFQPWESFPIRFASNASAPLRRTEYVSALPGVGWVSSAVARPDEYNGVTQSPMTAYRPGQRVADSHHIAPAVPGVDRSALRSLPCPACRQGDQLLLNVQPRTDAGGHSVRMTASATAAVSTQSKVYADGTLIATGTDPAGAIALPATASQLKLEVNSGVASPWATTSSKVTTAWTWRTAAPTGTPAGRTCTEPAAPCAFQPLLFAEYAAGVDTSNALPAGVAAPLTVLVRRQANDPGPAATALTLEVSRDDGTTWTPVTTTGSTGGRFTATVTPAAGSGFLSLRIHATDPTGSALDQTVIRALRVLG